jgi:SAM-dependent methyltransferase
MKNKLLKDSDSSNAATLTECVCPSCLSNGIFVFHKLNNVPVNSVLNIPTRETALNFPKGNISLGFCRNCGFISNVAFDPGLLEYSSSCEESQGFSETFNAFAHRTATYLIEKYDLYNKNILEIGCGKGEFLTLLCNIGKNRGVGFDPAYVSRENESKNGNRVTFIKDFYSERYASYYGDMICCRMTLEHIISTANFVSIVRRSIGNRANTIVFFQVPDVTRILRDCSFEDIYYEHCSYFSPGSLARLFRKCGFDLIELRTEYDGQYLVLEAKPASGEVRTGLPIENDLDKLKNYITSFQNNYQAMIDSWQKQLRQIKANAKRAVLWGSGSKGVAFLTTLGIYDEIEYVVDINPYRQGSYMAGTGQAIVAPGYLREYKPDIVIIMNPIYREEIQQDLCRMGLAPEILTLGK